MSGWDNENWDKEFTDQVKKSEKKKLKIAGELTATYCKEECPVDTGKLRDSLTVRVVGDDTVQIGSNLEYAEYVETGTWKMPPRPFMRQGLINAEGDIDAIFSLPIEE